MSCKFNAPVLLDMRRSIAKDPTLPLLHIAIIIKLIDDARHTHRELTGCRCWQDAIAEAPSEFALIDITSEAA
jgi:hypothetical protein